MEAVQAGAWRRAVAFASDVLALRRVRRCRSTDQRRAQLKFMEERRGQLRFLCLRRQSSTKKELKQSSTEFALHLFHLSHYAGHQIVLVDYQITFSVGVAAVLHFFTPQVCGVLDTHIAQASPLPQPQGADVVVSELPPADGDLILA